ncbi:MAG: hypothetical protein IH898_09965 [Planctomycetes bacterium]|nr:hypothetical protein [Planctomycetota bacterium]
MNRQTFATTLLLVTTLVTSVGCSSLNTGNWKFAKSLDVRRAMWWKSEKPEPQLPVRLVSTWTDTVLHRPGQESQRGFGGRLLFFGRESDDPVCVDGQLVVYAYDEANCDPRNGQPTRRFIFPREQFTRHYSESTLGPSYSVWLPWDAVGGPRKNISLIARFEPYQGQLIVGEQTRHLLPGTALAGDAPAGQPGMSEIQLAQHTTAAGAESRAGNSLAKPSEGPRREMTTTSIRLSEQWRDRFASRPAPGSLKERFSTLTTQLPTQPPIQPPIQPMTIPQKKGP